MKFNFLLYKILLRGERMDEHLFGNGQQTISHKEVLRVIDYKNPTECVGLVQSGPHHRLIDN
jgi:hypothetical protein